MDLAALIIASLSLSLGVISLVWHLAKHFSTHKIQYVPLDNVLGLSDIEDSPRNDKSNPSLTEVYKDFDDLDQDEIAYFNEQKNKKTKQ